MLSRLSSEDRIFAYLKNKFSNIYIDFQITTVERAKTEEQIKTLVSERKYKELIDLFESFRLRMGAMGPESIKITNEHIDEIISYLKTLSETRSEPILITAPSAFPDAIADAIIQKIDSEYRQEFIAKGQLGAAYKFPFYIKQSLGYDEVIAMMRKIMMNYTSYYLLPFIYSPNFKMQGKITGSFSEGRSLINLVSVYSKKKGKEDIEIEDVTFFGESIDYPSKRVKMEYTKEFYLYKFFGFDSKVEYVLASEIELPMTNIEVTGMLIPLRDTYKIGSKTSIATKTPFVFLIGVKKPIAIQSMEYLTAIKLAEQYTHDKIAALIFGKARHPIWFERMIIAWILSKSLGSSPFPLHIGIVAKAGTGKTTMLRAMHSQFNEPMPIFDGSSSTLKGLIPSYGNRTINVGYIVQCKKFAFIDEFLTALQRNKSSNDWFEVAQLNSILECSEVVTASGKGHAKINPTARCLFITNPKGDTLKTMDNFITSLDNPFLSRILWYFQSNNKQHLQFINSKKAEVTSDFEAPHPNDNWNACAEYLQTLNAKMDSNWIDEELEKIGCCVPEVIYNILIEPRFHHHIQCILDGIVKYRFLIGEKDTLECDAEDKKIASEIITTCIFSWQENMDLTALSPEIRRNFLPMNLVAIYEQIERNTGANLSDLRVLTNKECSSYLTKLQELKMIRNIGGKYYPYYINQLGSGDKGPLFE